MKIWIKRTYLHLPRCPNILDSIDFSTRKIFHDHLRALLTRILGADDLVPRILRRNRSPILIRHPTHIFQVELDDLEVPLVGHISWKSVLLDFVLRCIVTVAYEGLGARLNGTACVKVFTTSRRFGAGEVDRIASRGPGVCGR